MEPQMQNVELSSFSLQVLFCRFRPSLVTPRTVSPTSVELKDLVAEHLADDLFQILRRLCPLQLQHGGNPAVLCTFLSGHFVG